jgi:hypothetical protein
MIKLDAILLIAYTLLQLYSLFDCGRIDQDQVRKLPKWVWLIVILIIPLGAIFWMLFGRPKNNGGKSSRGKKPRIIPPDDDPDFLRKL